MAKSVRVGVIGVGHLGRHHVRIFRHMSTVSLVGIVDTNAVTSAAVSKEFGVRSFETVDALLPLIDAVSVAVPTSDHHAVVTACLMQNCHVLVEKPIASDVQQGEELVQLARSRGKVFHVGHVERFNPIVEFMRTVIVNPGFIECHRLSPFQPRGTDVDVVRDLMIHDIDLLLSLGLGSIQQIEARGLPVFTAYPDIANVRILFESGCSANLTASRISTGRLRKMRIYQRNRYISVDFGGKEAVIRTRRGTGSDCIDVENNHVRRTDEDSLTRELNCFVHTVAGRYSHEGVSGEEGLEALRVATQVIAHIQAGSPL